MARSEEQLKAQFEQNYPGRNWNQDCQAAVAHAAEYTTGTAEFYLTAKAAYAVSQIVSRIPAKAHLNDVHFWAIGPDWHTAVDLGGGRVLMASKHSDGSWGVNLGVTTVDRYTAATGADYRGFAHTNGVNHIQIAAPKPATGGSDKVRLVAKYLNGENLGKKTTAVTDGTVDQTGAIVQVYWWLVQRWGQLHDMYPSQYRLDGKVGRQTRKVEAEIYKRAKTGR